MMILRIKKKQKPDINPLTLEQLIELMLLLAPYIALIENHLPSLQRALNNTTGQRPQLLQALFVTLSQEIKPQDFTKAFAILLQKPPEWFETTTAKELVDLLPVLDEINDFSGIFEMIKRFGLTVKYA